MRFGVEAVDRSYLRHAKNREVIGPMLEDLTSDGLKAAIKKISARGKSALPRSKHMTTLGTILKHIISSENEAEKLQGYKLILREVSIQTPISALVPSQDPEAFKTLRMFLRGEKDIFTDINSAQLVTEELPVLVTAILSILSVEHQTNSEKEHFLPKCTAHLFEGISCLTSGFIRSGLISAVIIRSGVQNVGSSKTSGVQNAGGCKMPG